MDFVKLGGIGQRENVDLKIGGRYDDRQFQRGQKGLDGYLFYWRKTL